MKRLAIAVAPVDTLSFIGSVQALGPAPAGTSIAKYDGSAGTWTVSVSGIANWRMASPGGSLTGPDDASPPLPLGGGISTDNAFSVGESKFIAPLLSCPATLALAGISLCGLLVTRRRRLT